MTIAGFLNLWEKFAIAATMWVAVVWYISSRLQAPVTKSVMKRPYIL